MRSAAHNTWTRRTGWYAIAITRLRARVSPTRRKEPTSKLVVEKNLRSNPAPQANLIYHSQSLVLGPVIGDKKITVGQIHRKPEINCSRVPAGPIVTLLKGSGIHSLSPTRHV